MGEPCYVATVSRTDHKTGKVWAIFNAIDGVSKFESLEKEVAEKEMVKMAKRSPGAQLVLVEAEITISMLPVSIIKPIAPQNFKTVELRLFA